MVPGSAENAVVQAALLVRFTLSCVLLFAAVMKWRRKDDFAFLLSVLGRGWFKQAPVIRVIVIVSELVLGFTLFTGFRLADASIGTVALFGSFLVVLICAFKRGYVEDCACFGDVSGNPVGTFHLGRNAVLILLAVFLTIEVRLRPLVAMKYSRVPTFLLIEAALFVVVTFACYALLNEVNAAVKRARI